MIIRFLAALCLAIPLSALSASLAKAQSVNEMPGMAADMPLAGPQPPAKIAVDPPLGRTVEPRGRVYSVRYRKSRSRSGVRSEG